MTSRNAARGGVTLTEMLIVLAIIGMLMAILLPALQSARESGRRTACLNNQKQLGIAMLGFEQAMGKFPGIRNALGTFTDAPGDGVSWLVMTLPHLERLPIWESWETAAGTGTAGTEVYLGMLVCPSDEPPSASGAPNSYVTNRGQDGVTDATQNNAGVVAFRGNRSMAISDLIEVDGTAHTLLVSEKLDCAGATRKWSMLGHGEESAFDHLTPAATPGVPRANLTSNHGNGVVVTFCDGHGQFLRASDAEKLTSIVFDPGPPIVYRNVYQVLCDPRDGYLDPSNYQ